MAFVYEEKEYDKVVYYIKNKNKTEKIHFLIERGDIKMHAQNIKKLMYKKNYEKNIKIYNIYGWD